MGKFTASFKGLAIVAEICQAKKRTTSPAGFGGCRPIFCIPKSLSHVPSGTRCSSVPCRTPASTFDWVFLFLAALSDGRNFTKMPPTNDPYLIEPLTA